MTAWADDTIRANGIDIHFLRTGGGGPPVVLLHGFTDNGACWSRLARDLGADYDLIMPDARGHGRSSVPEQGYRTQDRVADLLGLIDALGLDRPALIGHSMGGLTAAATAAEAPARVRGVILEDPAFVRRDAWGSTTRDSWAAQHQAALATPEEALIAEGRAANPRWSPDTFGPWARAKHETSMRAFDLFADTPADPHALVARIEVPTLLVTGEPARGVIVSPELAAELQARNSRLRVAQVPGTGHCIRYEQPEQVAAIVRAFLAELHSGGAEV